MCASFLWIPCLTFCYLKLCTWNGRKKLFCLRWDCLQRNRREIRIFSIYSRRIRVAHEIYKNICASWKRTSKINIVFHVPRWSLRNFILTRRFDFILRNEASVTSQSKQEFLNIKISNRENEKFLKVKICV